LARFSGESPQFKQRAFYQWYAPSCITFLAKEENWTPLLSTTKRTPYPVGKPRESALKPNADRTEVQDAMVNESESLIEARMTPRSITLFYTRASNQ